MDNPEKLTTLGAQDTGRRQACVHYQDFKIQLRLNYYGKQWCLPFALLCKSYRNAFYTKYQSQKQKQSKTNE